MPEMVLYDVVWIMRLGQASPACEMGWRTWTRACDLLEAPGPSFFSMRNGLKAGTWERQSPTAKANCN